MPKDTEEVINTIDSEIIAKINKSNASRIKIIAKYIYEMGYKNIGIYKLASKAESDDIRNSSTIALIKELQKYDMSIYIYTTTEMHISGCNDIDTIENLFELSEIVLANRIDEIIDSYRDKIFTRDIFSTN